MAIGACRTTFVKWDPQYKTTRSIELLGVFERKRVPQVCKYGCLNKRMVS